MPVVFFKNCSTLPFFSASSALMLIYSKSLLRYMRLIVMNDGNSVMQGPHQVAQIFIKRSLSELFFTRSFIPFSSIIVTITGSFAQSVFALSTQFSFSAHFIEQPKTFVVGATTSLLFNNASIALRASFVFGVLDGFSTSSILPS